MTQNDRSRSLCDGFTMQIIIENLLQILFNNLWWSDLIVEPVISWAIHQCWQVSGTNSQLRCKLSLLKE